MRHEDHVGLIRDGVAGAGSCWLELGAGDGEFTLALADVLGPGARITTLDLDRDALARGSARVAERFPDAHVSVVVADLVHGLPGGPFDGVLAANSLHFVHDLRPTLEAIRELLGPGGRLVVVEYDSDRGNPWVPYPFSFSRWLTLAPEAGFAIPTLIHRVPSRFLGAMYAALTTRS